MNKEPARNGDEHDYLYWKHLLCVFDNHTGLGKAVKRRMNKRARRKAKAQIERSENIE